MAKEEKLRCEIEDKYKWDLTKIYKDEKEWQKALGEEKLPWGQYLATPEFSKATRAAYNLTSIPTFLIIAPEGKIIFSGHNSNELETILEAKNR